MDDTARVDIDDEIDLVLADALLRNLDNLSLPVKNI